MHRAPTNLRNQEAGDLAVPIRSFHESAGFLSSLKSVSTEVTRLASDIVDKSANGAIVSTMVMSKPCRNYMES